MRPAFLRDIKVKHIIQFGPASFKLCYFGSVMPLVALPPPAASKETLALEKCTTWQCRAPEMVDLFLGRPIDDKSVVWALVVLLYKLCYYITPFEEHVCYDTQRSVSHSTSLFNRHELID